MDSVRLPPRSTLLLIVAGFLALTFAVYGQALWHSFVAWDDTYLIYANPDIKGFSLRNLRAVFSTFDPELYIPLTLLSYQLDFTIGGLHPLMFHLTSILLHTANALLVAWLGLLLLKHRTGALLMGILFLIHPLQVEAVVWASARKDVLSTFFFLLSLVFWLLHQRQGSRKTYYLSLCSFLFGLLSKVMIVTLPIVLLLLRWRERRRWDKQMILTLLPFFLLSVVFGSIALLGKRTVLSQSTAFETILMAGKSTMFYVGKFLWPVHLSVLYPYNGSIEITSQDFLVPWILLGILGIAALWTLRSSRTVAFGFLFFLVTLLPTFTNFMKGGDAYFASDRYAYISSIGLFFLVALFWKYGADRIGDRSKRSVLRWGTSILLCILCILSFRQTQVWQDSVSLFTHTIRFYPDALAARINLGVVYRKMGLPAESRAQLEAGLKIRPHARIYTALAALDLEEGNPEKALEECLKAAVLDPQDPEPLYGIALAYARMGKKDEALNAYIRTLSLEPKHVAAHNNLAALYLERGETERAIEHYQAAIALDPSFDDAHYNLALIYIDQGRNSEGALELEETARLEGDTPDVLQRLASLYAKQNLLPETVRTLERLLIVDPSNVFARQMMEALLSRGMIP